jgi:hypothetical protein
LGDTRIYLWLIVGRRRRFEFAGIQDGRVQAQRKRSCDGGTTRAYRKNSQAGIHTQGDQSAYVREDLQERTGARDQAGNMPEGARRVRSEVFASCVQSVRGFRYPNTAQKTPALHVGRAGNEMKKMLRPPPILSGATTSVGQRSRSKLRSWSFRYRSPRWLRWCSKTPVESLP